MSVRCQRVRHNFRNASGRVAREPRQRRQHEQRRRSQARPSAAHYSASKAAVESLTLSWALELAPPRNPRQRDRAGAD